MASDPNPALPVGDYEWVVGGPPNSRSFRITQPLTLQVKQAAGKTILRVSSERTRSVLLTIRGSRKERIRRTVKLRGSRVFARSHTYKWQCSHPRRHVVTISAPGGAPDGSAIRSVSKSFATPSCSSRYLVKTGTGYRRGRKPILSIRDRWGARSKFTVCLRGPGLSRARCQRSVVTGKRTRRVRLAVRLRVGTYRVRWSVRGRTIRKTFRVRAPRKIAPTPTTPPSSDNPHKPTRPAPPNEPRVCNIAPGLTGCLHEGAICDPDYEALYRVYGYTCVTHTEYSGGNVFAISTLSRLR